MYTMNTLGWNIFIQLLQCCIFCFYNYKSSSETVKKFFLMTNRIVLSFQKLRYKTK